ncbi:sulfotransferase [Romeria aff. gracilis LEGE 07310]|uniref:Sulfotransferase n=1 Tax=Vasconcelosia minhoensis LEGE 07310 TaxID=915328 RepID=A0A8J7DMC3_9CYAN|nr:sulfotransferase [Romeria gracilis]MBE9076325.1 sulfotransferase [Romeria aff. gracilis LEGE 07310]
MIKLPFMRRTVSQRFYDSPNSIEGRIFVVGCPRSGTTLLQRLISNHPEITSFPESKFYQRLVDSKSQRARYGIVSKRARETVSSFLELIESEELLYLFPSRIAFVSEYSSAFVKVLDILSIQSGSSYWLEKTPAHLHYIDLIKKLVHKAKFVHIVREPLDVVASLYEVNLKYPELWWGSADIDRCIERWLHDVEITKRYSILGQDLYITYEELTQQTEATLENVCKFIGVEFTSEMLTLKNEETIKLVRKSEAWKARTNQPIAYTKHEKFNRIFNDHQKERICDSLLMADLSFLPESYKTNIVSYF